METTFKIVDFFKFIFGGTVEGQYLPAIAPLMVAFVFIVMGLIFIGTSLVLHLTKKGDYKLQLSLSIAAAVVLVIGGILFLFTKQLGYYCSFVRMIGGSITWEQYCEAFKLGYAPYVMGAFALTAGIAYPVVNLIYNKK